MREYAPWVEAIKSESTNRCDNQFRVEVGSEQEKK